MTQRTRAELALQIAQDLADNSTGDITPAHVRDVCDDIADSMFIRLVGAPGREAVRYVNGAWAAVSLVETAYTVVTRAGDFASVKAAVEAFGVAGGSVVPLPAQGAVVSNSRVFSLFAIRAGSSFGDLDDVWPVGGSAPWVWALMPAFYGWLDGVTVDFTVWDNQSALNAQSELGAVYMRLGNGVTINGTVYDVGLRQVGLPRPTNQGDDRNQLRVRNKFAVQPDPLVVLERP